VILPAPALAVRADAVSKMYRLFRSKRDRLREALHPFRRIYHREFWALRNITFEVPAGRTVGILGMNGSGKSTLLQIISGVLYATSGSVHVNGQVAALLELGAGFNPELTGRENVVLNGTILGLTREAIRDRMGDIETFADVGEFFDQPVKTYSSGMFMRVAFSTALYVDPDVLIIDEALSVGDAKFQEKCFRRFRDLQERGKSILLVTHDRSALPRYCDMGLLLHQGELVAHGDPAEIADLYGELLSTGRIGRTMPSTRITPPSATPIADESPLRLLTEEGSTTDQCPRNPTYNKYEHRFGNRHAEIIDYVLRGDQRINPTSIDSGSRLDIYFKILFHWDIEHPIVGVILKSKEGVIVYGINTGWMKRQLRPVKQGDVRVYRFSIRVDLSAGDWFIDLAVAETPTEICDHRSALITVYIMDRAQSVGLASLQTQFDEIHDDVSSSQASPPAQGGRDEAPPE